jgi:hypothetical protein
VSARVGDFAPLPSRQLFSARVGESWDQLPFPTVECDGPVLQNLTQLPDLRLGFSILCHRDGGIEWPLMAMDRTGAQPTILGSVDRQPMQFTYDDDLERGYVAFSSSVCAGILRFSRMGQEIADIWVGDGESRFRIDANLLESQGDCPAEGRADLPALSPDGGTLAFFASPDSIGHTGTARLDIPWNLFKITSASGDAELVARDLLSPAALVWSPTGDRLLFNDGSSRESQGLWIVDLATGETTQIAREFLSKPAWSPDGRQVIGLRRIGEQPDTHEIVSIQLP